MSTVCTCIHFTFNNTHPGLPWFLAMLFILWPEVPKTRNQESSDIPKSSLIRWQELILGHSVEHNDPLLCDRNHDRPGFWRTREISKLLQYLGMNELFRNGH